MKGETMRIRYLAAIAFTASLAALSHAGPPEVVPVPAPESAEWREVRVSAGKLVVFSAAPASSCAPSSSRDELGDVIVSASTGYCLVVTVSDTRTLEDDRSGDRACSILREAGHEIAEREIVRDDRHAIAAVVRAGAANPGIDAIVLRSEEHTSELSHRT